MRRWVAIALMLVMAMGFVAGCDEIEPGVGASRQPRNVRPAPEPIRTGQARRAQSAPAPAPVPSAAAKPAPGPPPPDATGVDGEFYQVVLTTEAAPADASNGLRYARVQCATARQVGEVLGQLYIPSGPSGGVDRYTLIYALRAEGERAAAHVAEIDVKPIAPADAAKASGGLACGVAVLHGLQQQPAERAQWAHVAEVLEKASHSESTAWNRWACAMLAGSVAADRLSEFDRAAELFRQAQGLSQPGSLEHLTSLYRRARALLQAGQSAAARGELELAISQFGHLRGSEPFERARRLLAERDRK